MGRSVGRPSISIGTWIASGVGLAAGLAVGYQIAYTASRGGMSGIGAAFLAFAAIVALAVLGVVAVVSWLLPRGRGRPLARALAAGLAASIAGAAAGYGAVSVFGLGYREPFSLVATGEATIRLDGTPNFAPRVGSTLECHSVADGEAVDSATALDLGELTAGSSRGTLRATLIVPAGSAAQLDLWIDGADIAEDAGQPRWNGPLEIVEASDDRRSGSARFAASEQLDEPGVSADWPDDLRGEVAWSCGGWGPPA